MSTAIMSIPMFKCNEILFKNTPKSKDTSPLITTNNYNTLNVNWTVSSSPSPNPPAWHNNNNNINNNNNNNNNKYNTTTINNNNNANNITITNAINNTGNNGHSPLRRSYTSLVTLIEQHRKLDRSVSEPTSRYKTELCRPFEENGACKYGDKCQFAHGNNELRNLARHPKYKTELCRTFHTKGLCPYGPRCHFIHNIEELQIHNPTIAQQLDPATQQIHIMNLNPLLNGNGAAALPVAPTNQTNSTVGPNVTTNNLNVTLLEQIAAAPQLVAAAAAAAATPNLMRTNSLNLGNNNGNNPVPTVAAYNQSPPPLIRTNSLSLANGNGTAVHHHHHHHPQHHLTSPAIPVIGATRPKPLNLSSTFSLGSTGDSISPSSSLSQSPTNSMASFFSDDCLSQQQQPSVTALSTTTSPFGFGQDFGLLATRQTPSPQAMAACSFAAAAVAAVSLCNQSQRCWDDMVAIRTPSPLSPNAESRLPVFNRISNNNTLSDFENLKI